MGDSSVTVIAGALKQVGPLSLAQLRHRSSDDEEQVKDEKVSSGIKKLRL